MNTAYFFSTENKRTLGVKKQLLKVTISERFLSFVTLVITSQSTKEPQQAWTECAGGVAFAGEAAFSSPPEEIKVVNGVAPW